MLWLHVASEDWRNNIFTVILSWLAFLAWNDNNILFHLCPALLQQNEMLKYIWGIHRGPTFRPDNFTLSVPLLSSIVIIVRRKGWGLWDYCLFLPLLFHINDVSFSTCACSTHGFDIIATASVWNIWTPQSHGVREPPGCSDCSTYYFNLTLLFWSY